MPAYRPGDRVRLVDGNTLCTILRDNEWTDGKYLLVTVDEHRATRAVRVDEFTRASGPDAKRPTVGDKVVIVGDDSGARRGRTGIIKADDHSRLPFFVEFDDQPLVDWYFEDQVQLVEDEPRPESAAPRLAVGDRVIIDRSRNPRGNYHGRTGTIIDHDGTAIPWLVQLDGTNFRWYFPDNAVKPAPEDEPPADEPNTEPTITVARRVTATIHGRHITAAALARAVDAIPGDLVVTVQNYVDRIEVTGLEPDQA